MSDTPRPNMQDEIDDFRTHLAHHIHNDCRFCRASRDARNREVLAGKMAQPAPTTPSSEPSPRSDAESMKAHVRVCADCSAGEFCDVGESFGGRVTFDYLYRITVANGCRQDAVVAATAKRRAARAALSGARP